MTPRDALQHYFGYPDFRDGQGEIVEAALEGRDILAIRPTGSGKTVCFQLPAMLKKGVTFVVSPLISLMQDQVDELEGTAVSATFLNSQLSGGEYSQRLKEIEAGRYKLVYLAPERLTQEKFLFWMRKIEIAMVVVDEAHCISQWGSDFRFSYAQIGHSLDRLASIKKRKIQRMALSASVTEEIQADIRNRLNLFHPQVFLGGFHRSNLRYRAIYCASPAGRWHHLTRFLKRLEEGAGIVYCISVKDVDRIWGKLVDEGYSVTKYHGRLKASEREANQESWMNGESRIIVATNAFGMGINKRDVRMVLHYGYPSSPEDYMQEAGRAGRDGKDSDCVVLWSKQDAMVQSILLESRFPSQELMSWVLARLHNRPDDKKTMPINPADYSQKAPYRSSAALIEQSLRFLEQQNILSLKRGPRPGLIGIANYNPQAQFDYGMVSARHSKADMRLRKMKDYLEAVECRAVNLVRYFDEDTDVSACGVCDNCLTAQKPVDGISSLELAALHLVHATKQRFGRSKITLTLDGVRDPKVLASKLHLYPGFGVCKGSATKASSLIQDLLTKKLLRMTVEPQYKVLALSDLGYRMLRDNYQSLHDSNQAKATPAEPEPDLVQALLDLRAELADRYGVSVDSIYSRKEADTIANAFDCDDPDDMINGIIGPERGLQFGFRIIETLDNLTAQKPS